MKNENARFGNEIEKPIRSFYGIINLDEFYKTL
jgi:hypothetical protein